MIDFSSLVNTELGYWLNGLMPNKVTNFCNDTRKINHNECFLAIKTKHIDGNNFLLSAKHKGASCAIVNFPQPDIDLPQFVCEDTIATLEQFAQIIREKFQYPIIAITGSMGKTTTKDILSLLLNLKRNSTVLNENNQLGMLMTLARLSTIESHGVIEIGIDTTGSIDRRLEILQPTNCIITGVCRIHMCGFKDEDNIAREKFKLAEFVINSHGYCIFPENLLRFQCFKDIKNVSIIPSTNTSEKVHYDVFNNGNIRIINLYIDDERYEFEVSRLMSDGMIKNFILSAIYVLLQGVSSKIIQERLLNWRPSYMRGNIEYCGDRVFYVDCYNANPSSFQDSLKNFDRLFPQAGRLFIIGCLNKSELGDDCADENFNLGFSLPLKEQDTVIMIGDCVDYMEEGVGKKKSDVKYNIIKNPNNLSKYIDNFVGVIYVKGHRSFHFEELIYRKKI